MQHPLITIEEKIAKKTEDWEQEVGAGISEAINGYRSF